MKLWNFLNISWTREFELKYLKLPESWKWNITLNEKKLILVGAIFHGTMIMGVEGYTEYRNKQNTEKTHTVSRYEFTTLFTFSSFGKWSVTVPLTLPSATSSSGNSTWCKAAESKKICWVVSYPPKCSTPPKFNIAPEKWWLEDYFPFWDGNFSGAMLNFQGVKRIPKTMVFRAIRQSHSIHRRQGGLPRVPSSISNGPNPTGPGPRVQTLRICRIARAIATYVGNGSVG